jgi:hypothetical protein
MSASMGYTTLVKIRLTAILTSMAIKGFTAKMTDIEEVSNCHRTTISRFLKNESQWSDEPIKAFIKNNSFEHIQQLSEANQQPYICKLG